MPSPSRREKIGTTYDERDKDKVMSFKQAVKCFTWSVLCLGTMAGAAEAQWSLLAPGDRAASAGEKRYYSA